MGCASTCVGYELTANINLDTSGNSMADTTDVYWNNGAGWDPIGSDANQTDRYQGDFKGNGYTISNLFISRSNTDDVGLFGAIHTTSRIESLGVISATVTARDWTGILVGTTYGEVFACYTSGSVTGNTNAVGAVGGLTGYLISSTGLVHSSYSTATVRGESRVGGLVGGISGGTLRNSYSTGSVALSSGTSTEIGGLVGWAQTNAHTISNSYWNTATSGQTTSAGSSGVTGRTTAQLQSPTDYTGIYATWNANLDGVVGNDDPWDFNGSSAYPTLIYHLTDYDRDEDNLIDVSNLAQLNAIRYNVNGRGDSGNSQYSAAFPNRSTSTTKRMGCPAGTCQGYELVADLDFDENGDGQITQAGDPTYWTNGLGFLPLSNNVSNYTTNFKGNGFTINNLFISRNNADYIGLFGIIGSGGRIESLGVTNANVRGQDQTGILTGRIAGGTVVACYVTGSVQGRNWVGGLVGYQFDATSETHSSYSTASVSGASQVGGLMGRRAAGNIRNSYSTGSVTGTGSNIGGFVGQGSGNVYNSYWDTTTSGQTTSNGGTGYSTADLQRPSGYTGIYANWNADIDGQSGNDDPWAFGGSHRDYPALKYGGHNIFAQGGIGDYDEDDDHYIDVVSLAQLSAIRHDLNGSGAATHNDYVAAFPSRDTRAATRMGCPSGTCVGYELFASLDFDSDGDGDVDGDDHDGDYWDSGAGWVPVAPSTINPYTGDFKGNGYTINNLFIDRPGTTYNGLFRATGSLSRIETLGITNANITGHNFAGILVAHNNGTIVACYTTGQVSIGSNQGAGGIAGHNSRVVLASYSTASVTGGSNVGGLIGHSIGVGTADVTYSYSVGRVTGISGIGGLIGNAGPTVTGNHWDTSTSWQASSAGGAGVTGKTTAELQSPTTYGASSGDTYFGWNADLDGQTGGDDPWTFGATNQYPVLKYAGMDTTVQFQVQPIVAMLTLMPSSILESGGMSTVTATLTRSVSVATTITVHTVAGAYTVGMDSTITIAAGQTANATDTVILTAVNNTRDEYNRNVALSAAGTGNVLFSESAITIIDDDAPPTLSINSPSAVEGDTLRFTASLDVASGKVVTVAYADASTGTATSGTDYTALTAGTLTFAVDSTSATIRVPVTNDSDDEPNETVVVTLSSAVNAYLVGGVASLTATGTIIDNDGSPTLSISSPSVIEGATGATLNFTVYLQPAHTSAVTVTFADAGTGSATSGMDYTGFLGSITIGVGSLGTLIPVSVIDDSAGEPNETVAVRLSNPSAGVMFDGGGATLVGVGTIIDDDVPMLSINSPQVAEGAVGATSTLRFTVSLSSGSGLQVTVAYADATTGSATSGTDYTALAAGTLTFAPSERSKSIDISVIGDATIEQDETVVITLSNADNAALAVATGTGTITNDDRPPTDPTEPEPEPDPDTDPTFTESVDPQIYRQDKAIEPLTLPAATDGEGTITYSLTELPEGLTFDAETRELSGTPTEAVEKAIYTLTATDEDGDEDTMGFFLTIVANMVPSFGDANVVAQVYTRKQEITSLTLPQASGGDEPLTYALTPALPESLSFNAETRIVSGTPLEAMDETTYTLTATDSDGDEATLMFTIQVTTDPVPIFGDTTIAAVYMQHRDIESMTLPQATGGNKPLTYTLTPALPEGLSFNVETLTVSGTPIKAMDETTYTLTATDSNGDAAHFMFTLEVPDLVPTFGDTTTIAAQSYLVNQEIASLTFPQASSGDGMLIYILLPFLPEGLNFDPTTRTLSGLPSEAKAQATYTMSALDVDGDVASLPFTLEVSLPSPDFNGDGVVNFADFLIFASKYGSRFGQERYDPRCDLNGNGEIDVDDFRIFVDSFGSSG